MNFSMRKAALGVCLAGASLMFAAAMAADETPIASTWKVQEFTYSYQGFTTAYSCNAMEGKLKAILTELGAHPNTRVRASGCQLDRPARNFFVTITTATPVPVAEHTPSAQDKSKEDLLKRLGVKSDFSNEQFPAVWKTVDLSNDRKLDLKPGDCELMQGLRDQVFPKLGIKIVAQKVSCMPNEIGITTPLLKVSALTPVKNAD